jgi:hypothetical protein
VIEVHGEIFEKVALERIVAVAEDLLAFKMLFVMP